MRDRRTDIPALLEHFIDKYSIQLSKKIAGIAQEVLSSLLIYPFPGNVRELEHIIERAIVLAKDGSILTDSQISLESSQIKIGPVSFADGKEISLKAIIEAVEKKAIIQSLENWKGNISKSAKSLGLSRPGLYQKIERYNIKL